MTMRQQELEDFKTRIDLREVAAAEGFAVEPKSSCRNSVAMKHPDGSKIVIGMGADRHMIYFSVTDNRDNGTVVDFVMNRRRVNLGQARKILRPFLGGAAPLPRPSAIQFAARLEPVPTDLVAVRARLAAMTPIPHDHAYLVGVRRIPPALLASDRFNDRILLDERGNVCFVHWNRDGIAGWEAKNAGFSGFAPGGVKGLFGSRKKDGDTHLAIAEAAIDALSYQALHGYDRMRVLSTAGQVSPDQRELLRLAMENMPTGSEIIAATDNDPGGDKLASEIESVFNAVERTDIAFRRHSPPTTGQDWNGVLQAAMGTHSPSLDP